MLVLLGLVIVHNDNPQSGNLKEGLFLQFYITTPVLECQNFKAHLEVFSCIYK